MRQAKLPDDDERWGGRRADNCRLLDHPASHWVHWRERLGSLERKIGWESDDRKWPANDIFLTQPGVPKGLCVKEGGGKYSREWSNGKATLDCSTWTAGLPFPSL